MGKLLTSLAMQQSDVHFSRQGTGIELFNHFNRRAGVSRECLQVNIAAKNQPERDGGVSQTIERAHCAMRTSLNAEVFQNPIK